MIPGSNHVVACGNCGAMAQYRTLGTESPAFASLWTDGCVTGPLLNPLRVLFVCRNCDQLQWMYEVKKVRIYETWNLPDEPGDDAHVYRAPAMLVAREDHYYKALRSGMAKEKFGEIVLRTCAWRRHNDGERACGVASLDSDLLGAPWMHLFFEEAHTENMERLGELLSQERGLDQILHAEILRQSGQYGAALDLLARAPTHIHPVLARGVRQRCEQRDSKLGEVARKR